MWTLSAIIFCSTFVLQCQAVQFFVTNPLQNTEWKAGQGANVSWIIKDAATAPTKINVELFPASDGTTSSSVRVVALLADGLDGSTKAIAFIVPAAIPSWQYAIRVYDPSSSDGSYSYSPAFWILNADGSRPSDLTVEPNFPRAAPPKQCLSSNCQPSTTSNGPDARKVYGSGAGSHLDKASSFAIAFIALNAAFLLVL